MIRIEHLNKNFKKLHVLDDITASFSKGEVVAIIGPNGSGKTTLIKSILGMVRPDSGTIYFNSTAVKNDFAYRKNIGYMPQMGRFPDNMKVGQLFKMIQHIRGVEDKDMDDQLLLQFNLPSIYNKPMRTLSGGTRQKVSAALAFLFNPEVLILDEPTVGLDPLSSEMLKEKIIAEKNRNKLVLISSHILSDLDELTTHVMYLQDGKKLFLKEIQTLKDETGEIKLGKAIARMMKDDKEHGTKSEYEVNSEHGLQLIKKPYE